MNKKDSIKIPPYNTPKGRDAFTYLSELCRTGLEKRYTPVTEAVKSRLNHELDIIKDMGLSDYFLIVRDIVSFAKSYKIPVGPGRGSAAGSIVFYTLGVTNIEPISHALIFERFINPGRVCIHEMTIDISPYGHRKVVDYATLKYGQDTGLFKKISFAALKELAVIEDAVNLINHMYNMDFDLENISRNRREVYDLISSGKTEGVFLLDDEAMQPFIQELMPYSLEEVAAIIALYRPETITVIGEYINGKNSPETITYKHPLLRQTLDVTYGCILYQEQIMEIAQNLAGYPPGRADVMRRNISGRKAELTESERRSFIYGSNDGAIPGCIKNGVDEKTAISIFDCICSAGNYALNKSHAAAYALLAYQMAYLKTFYNSEFKKVIIHE